MERVGKVLIILTILSQMRFEAGPKNAEAESVPPIQAPKGPVFNPLRVKPYAKVSVKV